MKARVVEYLPVAEHGEGVFWDAASGKLNWVDISKGAIHRFDLDLFDHEEIQVGEAVGFAVLDEAGTIVAGLTDGIYTICSDDEAKWLEAKPPRPNAENRFNDGKVAPDGTLFAGTMNLAPDKNKPATGALFRHSLEGLTTIEDNLHISNGVAWSPDAKSMYFADTMRQQVFHYDYDVMTGTPSGKKTFISVPEGEGQPDGLCVDSEGRIFVVLWGGGRVNVYDATGKLEDVIEVDASQPSSVAFGGEDLRTLFITTASVGLSAEQRAAEPFAGHFFSIQDMAIPGLQSTRLKRTTMQQNQMLEPRRKQSVSN